MVFDYDFYYRAYFVIPTVLIVICVILGVIIALNLKRHIKCKILQGWKDYCGYVLILFAIGLFLFLNYRTLAYGGIWLYNEDELSAKASEGTVLNIVRVGKHEVQIQLNNEIYIMAEIGNISKGDLVQYTYLPKSKFILQILKISYDHHEIK